MFHLRVRGVTMAKSVLALVAIILGCVAAAAQTDPDIAAIMKWAEQYHRSLSGAAGQTARPQADDWAEHKKQIQEIDQAQKELERRRAGDAIFERLKKAGYEVFELEDVIVRARQLLGRKILVGTESLLIHPDGRSGSIANRKRLGVGLLDSSTYDLQVIFDTSSEVQAHKIAGIIAHRGLRNASTGEGVRPGMPPEVLPR